MAVEVKFPSAHAETPALNPTPVKAPEPVAPKVEPEAESVKDTKTAAKGGPKAEVKVAAVAKTDHKVVVIDKPQADKPLSLADIPTMVAAKASDVMAGAKIPDPTKPSLCSIQSSWRDSDHCLNVLISSKNAEAIDSPEPRAMAIEFARKCGFYKPAIREMGRSQRHMEADPKPGNPGATKVLGYYVQIKLRSGI